MDTLSEMSPDMHLIVTHGPFMSKRGKRESSKEALPYVDPTEFFHTIIAEKGLIAVHERLEMEAQQKERSIKRKILVS